MNCIINEITKSYIKKGKTLEEARKYISIKYHINIDTKALRERVKFLQIESAL